mmetsp:Transcript_34153/g.68896  ORF Transcript_34153/g.68896 Transcript_34153/m.68896 type:complete len:86 (-) Transcript_34153:61-318(-)
MKKQQAAAAAACTRQSQGEQEGGTNNKSCESYFNLSTKSTWVLRMAGAATMWPRGEAGARSNLPVLAFNNRTLGMQAYEYAFRLN